MRARAHLGLALAASVLAAAAAGPARADDDLLVVNDSNATLTHDCAKHPALAISGAGNVVTVVGACKRVQVTGTGNQLAIATTDALAVYGAINVVTVDVVASIAVSGTENKVTWKTAAAGKRPKISDLGTGNTIAQAK